MLGQISHARRANFQDQTAKAGEVALADRQDQDPEYFVQQGIKVGAARWFVSEIRCWLHERDVSRDLSETLDWRLRSKDICSLIDHYQTAF